MFILRRNSQKKTFTGEIWVYGSNRLNLKIFQFFVPFPLSVNLRNISHVINKIVFFSKMRRRTMIIRK